MMLVDIIHEAMTAYRVAKSADRTTHKTLPEESWVGEGGGGLTTDTIF